MELMGKSGAHLEKMGIARLKLQTDRPNQLHKCIGCNLCYIACEDGAHQCIDLVNPNGYGLGPGRVPGKPVPKVRERIASV